MRKGPDVLMAKVGHQPTASNRLTSMKGTLAVTANPDADELLNTDPLALLLGMLRGQRTR